MKVNVFLIFLAFTNIAWSQTELTDTRSSYKLEVLSAEMIDTNVDQDALMDDLSADGYDMTGEEIDAYLQGDKIHVTSGILYVRGVSYNVSAVLDEVIGVGYQVTILDGEHEGLTLKLYYEYVDFSSTVWTESFLGGANCLTLYIACRGTRGAGCGSILVRCSSK